MTTMKLLMSVIISDASIATRISTTATVVWLPLFFLVNVIIPVLANLPGTFCQPHHDQESWASQPM